MIRPEKLQPKRWQLAPEVPFDIKQEMAHLHPVLLQVLYNRGITNPQQIEAFLTGNYRERTDPFLLKDMDKAVARIKEAIEKEETVFIYGDFDADGVTSTVLLTETLRGLGLDRQQAQPYIPDRVDEGYGLNTDALTEIKEKGARLVITVDCGIRSLKEIEHANKIGLDVIVTDHHNLGDQLPPATAVINPKRPDSDYPEKMLAGVGIAYKLAQALRLSLADRANFTDEDMLDLVALGTVADLAPLKGENRFLVAEGLRALNLYQRPGIEALAKIAGLKKGNITAESISFGLAPRINAAGRLAHAYDAARLLAVNNLTMAKDYARELNELNQERQRITAQLTRKAEEMIDPSAALLFVADSEFNSGIVGLVASRLAEKYYRPAIIIEKGLTESRGSCRSIPGFHITQALDAVAELLVRHGGHAQAAGFTIQNENLEILQQELTRIAEDRLDLHDLTPMIVVDANVNVADVDWALQGVLEQLEPTGNANARPLLMSQNVQVYGHKAVGANDAHLRLWVGDGRVKLSCIAFRQGAWAGQLPERVDLVYQVNINEWNGRRELQLVVEDIRPTEAGTI